MTRLLFNDCRAGIALSWTLLPATHCTGCTRERLMGCQQAGVRACGWHWHVGTAANMIGNDQIVRVVDVAMGSAIKS